MHTMDTVENKKVGKEEIETFKNQWETVFGGDIIKEFNLVIYPPYQFIDPKFGSNISTITLSNVNVDDFAEVINHINKSLKYFNNKEQFFKVTINNINYDAKNRKIVVGCDWIGKELPKFSKVQK
ncbi:hypothetical protein J7J90_04410 [Candidatus Micrarchaeota archaeon]|nr:hypothetical protein [Candidatus Micrarchaeota archaeon]